MKEAERLEEVASNLLKVAERVEEVANSLMLEVMEESQQPVHKLEQLGKQGLEDRPVDRLVDRQADRQADRQEVLERELDKQPVQGRPVEEVERKRFEVQDSASCSSAGDHEAVV